MRGTRGEAPHPGHIIGVFLSVFVSMFLFLVCRVCIPWLSVTVCPACMAGGSGWGVPGIGYRGIRIVEALGAYEGTRIVRTLVAYAVRLPLPTSPYSCLSLRIVVTVLTCGACHVYGPVHMVHMVHINVSKGSRGPHRRSTWSTPASATGGKGRTKRSCPACGACRRAACGCHGWEGCADFVHPCHTRHVHRHVPVHIPRPRMTASLYRCMTIT